MKSNALFAILSLPFFMCTTAGAKDRKLISSTTLSVFANFNSCNYSFSEKTPGISTKDHATNFGFEISKDIYMLPKNAYLSIGIRYASSRADVSVKSNMPAFDQNTSMYTYGLTYGRLTLPVRIGKTFQFSRKSDAHIDAFTGVSLGVSNIDRLSFASGTTTASSNNEQICSVGSYEQWNDRKSYASYDLGFRLTPFNFPNFTIGLIGSFDLTGMSSFSGSGYFSNDTRGIREDYKFTYTPKFLNLMLTVNYTFGKSWQQSFSETMKPCN